MVTAVQRVGASYLLYTSRKDGSEKTKEAEVEEWLRCGHKSGLGGELCSLNWEKVHREHCDENLCLLYPDQNLIVWLLLSDQGGNH